MTDVVIWLARGLTNHPNCIRSMSLRPPGVMECDRGVNSVPPSPWIRGLHLSSFQLNVSAFCGIGVH